jgi:VanZ family protein
VISRCIAWGLLAGVIFASLSRIEWRPVTGASADFERFIAFAAIGASFCFGYPKRRVRVLLFLVAVAVSLEAMQLFVPTRHGRVHDAAIKVIGAAIGVFLADRSAAWFPHLFRRNV